MGNSASNGRADRIGGKAIAWRFPAWREQWRTGTASYLLAHFAKSQLWHASTLLFCFFLTETCGLDARTMGFVMAGSLMLNGLIDAIVGAYWNGSVTSAAAATRRQASGAPVACLFFLLFCATPLLDAGQRVAWAMATLVAFRASYPFVDVPQNALVALIVDGADARCVLLARRNIASGLASLSVATVAAPLLIYGHGAVAWLLWAGCISLLVCATAWMLRARREDDVGTDAGAATDTDPRIATSVLLGTLAVMMVAGSTFRTLEPYHVAYAGTGMGLPVWAAAGGIGSQPLWVASRRRFGTTTVLAIAAFLVLIAAIVLFTPLRGTGAGGAVVGLGFGAGASGLWLILWSAMMARAATGHATGHVGRFTCVSKLAQATAMLLLGQVLAASPYRATLADPWSPPSLLMAGALCVIGAVCLTAIPAFRVSRTTCDGRPARRRRAAPTIRGRG